MADQLTRCNRRWRETGAENKIVEATFEQFEQLVAGRLLARLGFTEKATDLAFGNAIIEAQLLLFDQFEAIVRFLAHALSVLAGRVISLAGALAGQSGQFDTEGANNLESGAGITGHVFSCSQKGRHEPWRASPPGRKLFNGNSVQYRVIRFVGNRLVKLAPLAFQLPGNELERRRNFLVGIVLQHGQLMLNGDGLIGAAQAGKAGHQRKQRSHQGIACRNVLLWAHPESNSGLT